MRTVLPKQRAGIPPHSKGFATPGNGVLMREAFGVRRYSRAFSPRLLIAKVLILGLLRLAAPVFAQEAVHEEGRTRFRAVDIYIDSKGAPLAAWQIEFAATNGIVKIVGIEGGEGVFGESPFYDPKAIQTERVIIAAFSTEVVGKLPVGKTRVATIHLQLSGNEEPQFDLKVQTAGDAEGKRIGVEASWKPRMDTNSH